MMLCKASSASLMLEKKEVILPKNLPYAFYTFIRILSFYKQVLESCLLWKSTFIRILLVTEFTVHLIEVCAS